MYTESKTDLKLPFYNEVAHFLMHLDANSITFRTTFGLISLQISSDNTQHISQLIAVTFWM